MVLRQLQRAHPAVPQHAWYHIRHAAEEELRRRARLYVPPALAAPLARAFGSRLDAELAALVRRGPLALRINTLKATRASVISTLAADDITAAPAPLSPVGVLVPPGTDIAPLAAFRSGLIEPQDEGSQIAALLAEARPGEQVADYCAGAGGKTLAIAAAMQNRGRIVACDTSKGRLDRARVRLKRAGAENVMRRVLDAEGLRANRREQGRFDCVFVDAPCTGIGAWRRNPEARWSPALADLAGLTALQDRIIAEAAALVRPAGGRLIYVTCSPLREENDDRIAAFLAAQPGFRQQSVAAAWERTLGSEFPGDDPHTLRLTPALHGTDGFTVAILQRT